MQSMLHYSPIIKRNTSERNNEPTFESIFLHSCKVTDSKPVSVLNFMYSTYKLRKKSRMFLHTE